MHATLSLRKESENQAVYAYATLQASVLHLAFINRKDMVWKSSLLRNEWHDSEALRL